MPIVLLLASLSYTSISARIVVAVTFHEVDHAPDTEACTECDNECLKYAYCAVEKCHKMFPPFRKSRLKINVPFLRMCTCRKWA